MSKIQYQQLDKVTVDGQTTSETTFVAVANTQSNGWVEIKLKEGQTKIILFDTDLAQMSRAVAQVKRAYGASMRHVDAIDER